MALYYDHPLKRYATPDDLDHNNFGEYANAIAGAWKAPSDNDLKREAFYAAMNLAWELTQASHHSLTQCMTSTTYQRMIVGVLTAAKTLRAMLRQAGVSQHNVAADGAIFLGFELFLLPVSLGEPSILVDYHDRPEFTYLHWMNLPFACRRDEVLWPNLYERMSLHELFFNEHGDERDIVASSAEIEYAPEVTVQQSLTFDERDLRQRIRDNYSRCEACVRRTIDDGLSARQMRLRLHYKVRSQDILAEQTGLEYKRDQDWQGPVDVPTSPKDARGSDVRVIAVRTDSILLSSLNDLHRDLCDVWPLPGDENPA